MLLPSETTKSVEQIAERLRRWATIWSEQLHKDKPRNLPQICRSLLSNFGNADFPTIAFKMEFFSSLKKTLEQFDYAVEELHQYMPDMAKLVESKYNNLIAEANSVVQLPIGSYDWLKKFNSSRNYALDLAKTLQHVVQIASYHLRLRKNLFHTQNIQPLHNRTR